MATTYDYGKDPSGKPVIESASPSGVPDVSTAIKDYPIPPVNTMPGAALGSNPAVYTTQAPTTTSATGLAETATASKDATIAQLQKEADALKVSQEADQKKGKSLYERLGGVNTSKVAEYQSSGLNDQKKGIDEITNQMDALGRSYDKQIEAVTKNAGGKLEGGVNIEVNRLTKEKATTLADLAIVLNAKNRNYDTAKTIIDQKAAAETEDLKNKISGLEFFYNDNKATLNKDQQAVLTDKIDSAKQEYETAKAARTEIGKVQLEAAKNGAPLAVIKAIGSSKTYEDAIGEAGTYMQTGTGGTFTGTQLNTGASNAGLSLSEFGTLTKDDKNYFINSMDLFKAAKKQVDDGIATTDDLKAAIDSAPLSDAAKQILYKKGGIDPNAPASGGPGFFSNAWNFVSNIFGA